MTRPDTASSHADNNSSMLDQYLAKDRMKDRCLNLLSTWYFWPLNFLSGRALQFPLLCVLNGWMGAIRGIWLVYLCNQLRSAVLEYARSPAATANPFWPSFWVVFHVIQSGYEARWILGQRIQRAVDVKCAQQKEKRRHPEQHQQQQHRMTKGEKRRAKVAVAAATPDPVDAEHEEMIASHRDRTVCEEQYTKYYTGRFRTSVAWRLWNFTGVAIPEIVLLQDPVSLQLMKGICPIWMFLFSLCSTFSLRDPLAPPISIGISIGMTVVTFIAVRIVLRVRRMLGLDAPVTTAATSKTARK